MSDEQIELLVNADVEVRDLAKREIGLKVLPWDETISTRDGLERFERGALAHIDPKRVVLRMDHTNPAAGRGIDLEERADGAYMTFRVSKTQRGDEILELAADGVTRGASVGFKELPDGTTVLTERGRRVNVRTKVDLREVSTTWQPAYPTTEVLFVREDEHATTTETDSAPVEERTEVEAPMTEPEAKAPNFDEIVDSLSKRFETTTSAVQDKMLERFEQLEEKYRATIIVPGQTEDKKPAARLFDWVEYAVKSLSGARVTQRDLQERDLADVVTPENPGLVPDAFVPELIRGAISPRRPFLNSTRQIPAPSSGMSLVVPIISQHVDTATQSTEKSEVQSRAFQTNTDNFDAVTVAGGADISIQMLRRSTPEFLNLFMQDLAASYAANADILAVTALLDANVTSGTGALDPEDLTIGEAWANSIAATAQAPDTIWLSSAAVGQFIDAKSDGTNRPLYFNLNANFAAGTGTGGNVSALRPVYVPALDNTGTDVIVGPSDGFVWAEDGTFTLQADNPTLAGRDIAIVGILFFVPRYPEAFTTYALATS